MPYVEGLKELEKFGADFIVMVCNTIHLFYDRLQKEVNVPIIDLRKELKNFLIRNGIKSALVIGTPNTIRKGLYRFEGVKTFEPDDEEIKLLSEAIFIFNKGVDRDKQVEKVRGICRKYFNLGAETVILGCTEFAVMLKDEKITKINTIDVLIDAVIAFSSQLSENSF